MSFQWLYPYLEFRKENQDFYNLEFIFDSDSKCYIQVHYCARELVEGNNIKFDVRLPDLKPSEKFYFDVGADQVFNHLELAEQQFDPQKVIILFNFIECLG